MVNKTLGEWLQYLEAVHPANIELGLDRVRAVAERMKLLTPAPFVITVAGTNGKGSTVTFLSEFAQQAGLKVGSYMSPHFHQYNERVQINSSPVSDQVLIDSFAAIEQARGEIELTYFEYGTLSALWVFKQAALDVVVLEIGLGGRLDAVNVVDNHLSVVTSIGLDHQDWLGSDVNIIAGEKAGIFRDKVPAIIGQRDPQPPLRDRAQALACPTFVKGEQFDFTLFGDHWHWHGLTRAGEPLAFEQLPVTDLPVENAATALQALAACQHPQLSQLSQQGICEAMIRAFLPGRFQTHQVVSEAKQLNLIFDVAHNPQAAAYLCQQVQQRNVQPVSVLLAMLSDKDPVGVVNELIPVTQHWFIAGLPEADGRGQTAEQLMTQLAGQFANATAVTVCDTVTLALEEAVNTLPDNSTLLVIGSFYTTAEALTWLPQSPQ